MLELKTKVSKLETSSFLTTGEGLYVSVVPSADSIKVLDPVIDSLLNTGLSYTGLPNLHVTVIYSSTSVKDVDEMYRNAEIDPAERFIATIEKFEYWPGHKNQGVLVLKMKSPALEKVHQGLREDGYEVTYPDYQAHMTFIDNLHEQGFDEVKSKKLVQFVNAQFALAGKKIELTGMKAESTN